MAIETRGLKEWIEYLLDKIHKDTTPEMTYLNPENNDFIIWNDSEFPAGMSFQGEKFVIVTKVNRTVNVQLHFGMYFEKAYLTTGISFGKVKPEYTPFNDKIADYIHMFDVGFYHSFVNDEMDIVIPQISYQDNDFKVTFVKNGSYRNVNLSGDYFVNINLKYII